MGEIIELGEKMRDMALKKIARDASQIRNPSKPWLESGLINYGKTSVAYALENYYKVPRDGLLWKLMELKLVNDEVAPLDEMNFLGLLSKVKGGQGKQFNTDLPPKPHGVLGGVGDFSLRRRLPDAGQEDSRRDPGRGQSSEGPTGQAPP
jgi:hypothetical protein